MIEDDTIQLAVRTRLLTLSVANTGAQLMSATATGGEDGQSAYILNSGGSLITAGLRVGMEVVAGGFIAHPQNSGYATIVHLTPTIATVNRALVDDAVAGARSLAVGLPKLVSWENIPFNREEGRPYADESYLPGPAPIQRSGGQFGSLEAEPQYLLTLYIPRGVGISADSKYTNALRRLFPPGQRIVLPDPQDQLNVRRDLSPNRDQRKFDLVPGFVTVQFSIPMRLYTPNSI